MNISLISGIALAAVLPLVSACGDDNGNPTGAATNFSATLTGAQEVPPVPPPTFTSVRLEKMARCG